VKEDSVDRDKIMHSNIIPHEHQDLHKQEYMLKQNIPDSFTQEQVLITIAQEQVLITEAQEQVIIIRSTRTSNNH
jgi:hypothetical protein